MKIMKSILTVAILAAVFASLAPVASAEQYSVTTLRSTNVAATTNVGVTNNIVATKKRFVAIGITVVGGAACTNDVTATFERGLNSSVWDKTTRHTVTVTPTGTTPTATITNIDTMGYGYLRLVALTNASSVISTTVVYSVTKPEVLDQ